MRATPARPGPERLPGNGLRGPPAPSALGCRSRWGGPPVVVAINLGACRTGVAGAMPSGQRESAPLCVRAAEIDSHTLQLQSQIRVFGPVVPPSKPSISRELVMRRDYLGSRLCELRRASAQRPVVLHPGHKQDDHGSLLHLASDISGGVAFDQHLQPRRPLADHSLFRIESNKPVGDEIVITCCDTVIGTVVIPSLSID